MKHASILLKKCICGFAFIVGASLGFLAPVANAQSQLTFCYDPYPPFSFGDEGVPTGGLKVQLLNEVVAQIDGLEASVVLLPWKRCQAQVREGRIDGILPLFENAERQSYMIFSSGTFDESSSFFYDQDRFLDGLGEYEDFNELAGFSLGMLIGSYIDEEMEQAFQAKTEIVRARDTQSLFQMLERGRVDLIATDSIVGRYQIAKSGLQGRIKPIEKPIQSRQSKFGLSKLTGAEKYLAEFNSAIEVLRTSGRLMQIQNSTDYE